MLERLIILWANWRERIFGRSSGFKAGDLVIFKDGSGYPMLITEVNRIKSKNHYLLYCRWYDTLTKETRYNLIPDEAVRHFDWNKDSR